MNSAKRGNKFMFFLIIYIFIITNFLFLFIFLSNLQLSLPAIFMLQQIFAFFIPFVFYKIVTKQNIKDILFFKSIDKKNILLIILISLLIQPSMMLLSGITSMFSTNYVTTAITSLSNFPFILGFIAIAIFPPILEEIIFRGVIYKEYENISIKKAALINGLFFGIMHMNLQQAIYAMLLGVFLTYLIYYTKSILAPILSHFIINATQFSMAYLAFSAVIENDYMLTQILEPPTIRDLIPISILSLITIPFVVKFTKSFLDHNKENIKNESISNEKINTWEFKAIIILFLFNLLVTWIFYNL